MTYIKQKFEWIELINYTISMHLILVLTNINAVESHIQVI